MNLDATSLGDAFLFEQGFAVAWLGWQFDLPERAIRIGVPSANVSGPVRQSIIASFPGSHVVQLGGPDSQAGVSTKASLSATQSFDIVRPRARP